MTPRFSLRTGLVLFLVFGASFGMAARWAQKIRQQGEAQRRLLSRSKRIIPNVGRGVEVYYAPEQGESWTASLVRQWIHPEYERRFSGIQIDGAQLDKEIAQDIELVFGVESIVVYSTIRRSALSHLVSAPGLKRLHLFGGVSQADQKRDSPLKQSTTLEWIEYHCSSPLPENLGEELVSSPSLKKVWLHSVHPKDLVLFATPKLLAEFSVVFHLTSPESPSKIMPNPQWELGQAKLFEELSKREQLERLRVFSADLSNPQHIKRFCETSKIRYLHLEGCYITPECLKEIAKLKKIETLHLHWSPMTREHLEILATMNTLRGIHALRCDADDVTNASVAKLKAALPRCKITRYLR